MTNDDHDRVSVRPLINWEVLYIDGEWMPSKSRATLPVVNPASEEVIGCVPDAVGGDVDRAVSAARAAFLPWSETTASERSEYCRAVAAGLNSRREEIADLTTLEMGMVRSLSLLVQANLTHHSFARIPSLLAGFPFESTLGTSRVLREPVGVVGCITPWNYPLPQVASKVATALAAGCTVVVKPSEVAPLTSYLLAEVIHEAALPPGVFNLVTGTGAGAGEALVNHLDVDMVSFTGSTQAGSRVAELCARRVAKVALELGGKSACVVLPGADLARATSDCVSKAFLNSGQTCSALTRLVVSRRELSEIEDVAVSKAKTLVTGDPLDPSSRLGPVVSAAQWARVQNYIGLGIEEGARLLHGGPGKPEGLETGFYVQPTIFSDVRSNMRIAQEEIFGPVLSIIPYDDPSEAVDIANDSVYGLGGAVWAASADEAIEVAKRIRTGQLQINDGAFNPDAPFGGYKRSGLGREYGEFGLSEFLEVKSLQL